MTGSRGKRTFIAKLSASLDLTLVTPADLSIRREGVKDETSFIGSDGEIVSDEETVARFHALAVPPAYTDVMYAHDPRAHIQAIGTDTAGRLQYRYHADWTVVREAIKGRRLIHLVEALPTVRRVIAKDLRSTKPTRQFALATVLRLIERTAIRAGGEAYEKASGTRGAATLRKSNISLDEHTIHLKFRAKAGKTYNRSLEDKSLAKALASLLRLPGKRLFQFKDESGEVRALSTNDMNAYLREASQRPISVKDFRTLVACASAVETLSEIQPAESARKRQAQITHAIRLVSEELSNTPAVARKSYVHQNVIEAFETGKLQRLRARLKPKPFSPKRERLLLSVMRSTVRA